VAFLNGSSSEGRDLGIVQPGGEIASAGHNSSQSRPQCEGASKRMEAGFSVLHPVRARNNGHKLKQGSFR